MHRDIKLENLLYDTVDSNSIVKVGDFGFACMLDKEEKFVMTTVLGTPGYTGKPRSLQPPKSSLSRSTTKP